MISLPYKKKDTVSYFKTRKGKLIRKASEHYFHTNIFCGSTVCKSCTQLADNNTLFPLSESSHYIFLDSVVILANINILELLDNFIITDVNLSQISHASNKIYKRLLNIILNKHVHILHTQSLTELYSDNNIYNSAVWYNNHLNNLIKIVYITNTSLDSNNTITDSNSKVSVLSIDNYIKQYHPNLTNINLLLQESNTNSDDVVIYPDYCPITDDILKHVKTGKYIQGYLRITSEYNYDNYNKYTEGKIYNAEGEDLIIIRGLVNLNRAFDGDTVIVEPINEKKNNTSDPGTNNNNPENYDIIVEENLSIPTVVNKIMEGKVIAILQRNFRNICGSITIDNTSNEDEIISGYATFVPVNKKLPNVRFYYGDIISLYNQRIVIAINEWVRTEKIPTGHFVKKIGQIGDLETENQVILIEHQIRDVPWNDAIISSLSFIKSSPNPPTNIALDKIELIDPPDNLHKLSDLFNATTFRPSLNRRIDIRSLLVCSVDPIGCTDIDDALSCVQLSNNNFMVGVHIADVSHYVEPNSPLDLEAALRCNSVYLVNRRIDMLPTVLSSDLCSLVADVDRFAFSAFFEISPNGKVISSSFFKTVIRVFKNLSYFDAQDLLNLPKDATNYHDPIVVSLRNLNHLAKKLLKIRQSAGALFLESLQVKIELDELKNPSSIALYKTQESNSLVEEFMLLANSEVARFIENRFPRTALLRRHPLPDQKRFNNLISAINSMGFSFDASSSVALSNSLDKLCLNNFSEFNTLIRFLITRCLSQAKYFVSGDFSAKNYLHYGLAASYYTHFTSPIRRYSDLIVHRLLFAGLNLTQLPEEIRDKTRLRKTADDCNFHHTQAQYVSRASSALYQKFYFKSRSSEMKGVLGIVIGFKVPDTIIVLLFKYGLEIPIHLPIENNKGYEYQSINNDNSLLSFVSEHNSFKIFDKVFVDLIVDFSSGNILQGILSKNNNNKTTLSKKRKDNTDTNSKKRKNKKN